jgi:tetratricopeptide (TPR) repeat protein
MFAVSEEVAALESSLSRLEGLARMQALIALAWQLRQRDCDRALQLADEAEAMLGSSELVDSEWRWSLARIWLIRGEVEWFAGNLDAAENHADAAKMAFERLSDPLGSGDAQWLLAFVWLDRGNMIRCDECLALAAAAYQAGNDPVRMAIAAARSLHMASFRDANATRAALTSYVDPAAHYHASVKAWLESAQAIVAGDRGDMNSAVQFFLQAVLAAQESGQVMHAILWATNGADNFANLGDLESALEWDERAL